MHNPNVFGVEGYAKARLWIIELKVGRNRDMMGYTIIQRVLCCYTELAFKKHSFL